MRCSGAHVKEEIRRLRVGKDGGARDPLEPGVVAAQPRGARAAVRVRRAEHVRDVVAAARRVAKVAHHSHKPVVPRAALLGAQLQRALKRHWLCHLFRTTPERQKNNQQAT